MRSAARQPFVGIALAAAAGIGLAELGSHLLPANGQAWIGLGLFVALEIVFLAPRGRGAAFYAFVAAGYAALHLFASNPVAATALSREIAAPGKHVIEGTGTVLDPPRASGAFSPQASRGEDALPTWHFTVALEDVRVRGRAWPCHARVSMEWREGARALAAGDRLVFTGLAENIAGPRNPDEFDRAAHARRLGVLSEIQISGIADARVDRPVAPWQPAALATRFHNWMQGALCLDLHDDPPVCAVVSTLLLGLRNDPGLGDMEPMFQRTGTLHYFAIDGLKLGLLSALLLRALTIAGVPRRWAGALIIPVLLGYALATGLGPASLRAVIVASVLVGGAWIDRPARPFNSLGAAAALILLCDTQQLFDLGFRLTFLVVLAILAFARPLNRWMARVTAPDAFIPRTAFSLPRRTWETLRPHVCELTAVAIAAWLGSLPMMALDFGEISFVSPVANVVAFPLALGVLGLAVLSLSGAWLSTTWAVWINNTNWLAAHGMLAVVRLFDQVPGGSIHVSDPSLWFRQRAPLEMTILDLGTRARAIHLHAAGSNRASDWLVDAGRPGVYLRNVRPFLIGHGVDHLGGGLVFTQADADHLAGGSLAIGDFPPARIVGPPGSSRSPLWREFVRAVAERKMAGIDAPWHRGTVFPLAAGAAARGIVLYPPEPAPAARNAAGRAAVLRIEAAGWRVLLVPEGGAGVAGQWLLDNDTAAELNAAVVVSDGPLSPEFERAASPRLVIVRPSERGAERDFLKDDPVPNGSRTIFQEEGGAVELRLFPERIEANTFVDGQRIVLPR